MKTESTFCGLLIKGDNLNFYLLYHTYANAERQNALHNVNFDFFTYWEISCIIKAGRALCACEVKAIC